MSEAAKEFYYMARTLFEEENYEGAITYFIEAYNRGEYQEEIIQDIYNCFILPNDEQFKENYKQNSFDDIFNKIGYENLTLDFIPVSNEKYYIFDKKAKEFKGSIDIEPQENKVKEKAAKSLLIADYWDIREMLEFIYKIEWQKVYLFPDKEITKFLSFFKLPGLTKTYFNNCKIFDTVEMMKSYFEQNDNVYIPRRMFAMEAQKYTQIFGGLHNYRITKLNQNKDNVLLSICIPSYNRGTLALEAVQTILKSEYDTEIEIIVSNNGSNLDVDGYKEIKNMRDSRIKYSEFETGQGYATNIHNVLQLATGKFAILASDEDRMITKNLENFLDYLVNHKDAGYISSEVVGSAFALHGECKFDKGAEAIHRTLRTKYLTGNCINVQLMKKHNALEKFEQMRGNVFLELYAHCVVFLLTGIDSEAYTSGIQLWKWGEPAKFADFSAQHYSFFDSRIVQQNELIKIINELPIDDNTFEIMLLGYIKTTYRLMQAAACGAYKEEFNRSCSWREACLKELKNNMELLNTYQHRIKNGEDCKKKMEQECIEWFKSTQVYAKLSASEQLHFEIINKIAEHKYKMGMNLLEIDFDKLEQKIGDVLLDVM